MSDRTLNFKIRKPESGIPRSSDISVLLDNGDSLGMVQSIHIDCIAGDSPFCTITTILSEANIELLQKNTDLRVISEENEIQRIWNESKQNKN